VAGPRRKHRRLQVGCRRWRSRGRCGPSAIDGPVAGARARRLAPTLIPVLEWATLRRSAGPQKICRRMVRYVLGF
jgi:hypothetical protein